MHSFVYIYRSSIFFCLISKFFLTVATQTRNMKEGTNKYHVGVSSKGMNAVWRQGTAKPDSYQYSFSFMAYERQEQGTIPFAVTMSGNGSNVDCFIDELTLKNNNAQPDFIFWVYPEKVYASKRIILTSKLKDTESSEYQYYYGVTSKSIDFWSPTLKNDFGNFHLISTFLCDFNNYVLN